MFFLQSWTVIFLCVCVCMRWGHISKPQEQKTILQPFYLLLTLILSACVISSPFTFLLFCPCSHFHYRALLSFPLSSPCYPALPFPFPPNSLHLYPTLSHFPSLSQIPLFLSILFSFLSSFPDIHCLAAPTSEPAESHIRCYRAQVL